MGYIINFFGWILAIFSVNYGLYFFGKPWNIFLIDHGKLWDIYNFWVDFGLYFR